MLSLSLNLLLFFFFLYFFLVFWKTNWINRPAVVAVLKGDRGMNIDEG